MAGCSGSLPFHFLTATPESTTYSGRTKIPDNF